MGLKAKFRGKNARQSAGARKHPTRKNQAKFGRFFGGDWNAKRNSVFRFVCRNKRRCCKAPFRESQLTAVPTVGGVQRFCKWVCCGAVKWHFWLLWCCKSSHPACFRTISRCCAEFAKKYNKKGGDIRQFKRKTLDFLSV